MGTVRRTITLLATLDAAAEAAVDAGHAPSVSALIADATRDYLHRLSEEALAVQTRRLDRDAETQLVAQARAEAPAGWSRLGAW
jgi:hypothetical protein